MFSTLPQSVHEEGWQAWEAQHMQWEDFDAPMTKHETSDSEMSCLSVADSPITRRRKLDDLTQDKLSNLRSVKRKTQRTLHDQQRRNKSKNTHLDNLLTDVSTALSRQTYQTRECNGRFGQLGKH